jgi:hypothetical protein
MAMLSRDMNGQHNVSNLPLGQHS